ncbi:MAG: DUF4173 domain-containing protein [Hespellia sp.]|nr:DUF4173 domain-containing protein [Hespellia sp.]
MKEYYEPRENYALFGGMCLLYGVFFTFCLYRNVAGITFPLYVLATIVFAVYVLRRLATQKKAVGGRIKLKKGTIPYFAGMMVLGVANACTTNGFFLLFDWIGMALLFVVAMVHQFYDDNAWNFQEYFKRLVVLFFSSLGSIFAPVVHGSHYLKGKENSNDKKVIYVILGLGIAFAALCIIFPLLLSSDLIFQNVFARMFQRIDVVSIIMMLLMVIAGTVVSYAFLCGLCKRNLQNRGAVKEYQINAIVGVTFTAVIASIYILYSGIQVLYLFMGMENGLPQGVTYSQYAHSGFWQLLFVSILNFFMVLGCKKLFAENKILNGILTAISLCTFVMISSAMYRMVLYVQEYYLTFLRLLVLWFLVVLIFIMAGTVLSIYRKGFPLFRYSMIIVAGFYMVLSLARPDYQIAKYNVAHDSAITVADLEYLIYNLSDDAAPVVAGIDSRKVVQGDTDIAEYTIYGEQYALHDAKTLMDDYFYAINQKYEDSYFRKANFSKWRAREAAEKYLGS